VRRERFSFVYLGFTSMVLVVAVLGCWRSPAARAAAATLPPSQTVSGTISEQEIAAATGQLDKLASDLLEATGIPGLAVAVVWQGKTIYAKGFGVRRIDEEEPVDADTVFQIASLSKSIAASVVSRQVGDGVVTWDTPVVSHLPWFALSDPWVTVRVTLADLFSHRSGLPDHAGDLLEGMGYDRRQILERLRYLPLAPFRATYAYTNFGLTAAAESVARAAGTDWASLCRDAIYGPLSMTSTSSRHADFRTRDNRASGHILKADRFELSDSRQPDAQSPAGGVSSSVNDFARWMIMVLGHGRVGEQVVVDEAALLQAVIGHVVSSPSRVPSARTGLYGYGFGVSTKPSGRVVISHSGAFSLGAATNYVLLPSEDLGIVVFSNAFPVGAVEALSAQFMDLVQFGTVSRDWLAAYGALFAPLAAPEGELVGQAPPTNPVPPGALSSYVGTYANDYFGNARVALQNGGLVLTLGPEGQSYPLTHWDADTFVMKMYAESFIEGSLSAVTFDREPSGQESSRMTVELLNENGLGTFPRRPN